MQIWEEIDIILKSKKRWIIILIFLFLTVLGSNILNSDSKNNSFISAQSTDPEIADIFDRFIFLNWSSNYTPSYNSYRIEIYDNQLNESFTWSMIYLNQTINVDNNVFSLANYSKMGAVFPAQKIVATNFSLYMIPLDSESIQVKITGLTPSSTYSISIYSANSSVLIEDDNFLVLISSEILSWESEEFDTLQSPEEALQYSRKSTYISLLIIIVIFIILFAFLARKDVPFNRLAYLFIFPALFALVVLEIYPIIYGVVLSFTSYNLKRGEIPTFNWLQNYAQISENPQLPIAFTTTMVWSIIIIFAKIVIGFFIAYLIQYKLKRKVMWYLLLYLPWAIPSYIKILSWRTFIHGNAGISFFNFLFGTNVNLISQPYTTLIVACFVEVWDSIPLITTLFLGGLSSIPKEIDDLAEVDQIREGTKLRRIIIPLIKPIILPAIILEIIKTFGSFNVAFLLTKGYPLLSYGTSEAGVIGATDLFSTFTFYMFYQKREVGISAAYSTIMSLLTLFFVIIWIKMSRGTESSFQPTKPKKHKSHRITFLILCVIQSLGYFLAGVFGFRYFGIYWNSPINYIFASFYFILFFLMVSYKEKTYKVFKAIIILDLIFSLAQFFFYQMWFAFNWNIFLIAIELFIFSGVSITRSEITWHSFIRRVKERIFSLKKKASNFLQKIDKYFIEFSSIHIYFSIQIVVIFISNIVIKTKDWYIWLLSGLLLLVFLISLFSEFVMDLSVLWQPILWISLVFGWGYIGWKVVHIFFSFLFLANYSKIYAQRKKEDGNKNRIYRILNLANSNSIILLGIIVVSFIPLWNIFWIAFSPNNIIVPTSFFPKNPTLENFRLLFTQESIHIHFGNSFIIALGSALICVLLTTLAAYAFSRYTFKARKELMVGVFVLKMFTGILTLIPFYLIMYNLGLIDTYIGVILAYSTHTIPLGLWIVKGYIDSIPKELDESAQIMGNSPLRVLRKIVLPLAGPAIAIAFILNFLAAWNGFLLSFVLLQTTNKYTLPIKLYTFIGSIESTLPAWGMFAASSILIIIPLLVIFVFLKNYLIRGIDTSINMRDV